MNDEEKARGLFDKFWQGLKELFTEQRAIKDVDSWDGSPSRWPDTDSYCASCLIDVNSAAGREEKAQTHCKLPVRGPGDSSDTFVRQAVHAAAGGRGITAVTKPADVPQDAWDSAVTSAANTLVRAYGEMDEEPPESVVALTERAISGHMLQESLWQRIFELDDQIEGSDHYFVDTYFDDTGMYGLYVDRGKLYRYQVVVNGNDISLGERIEVMEVHQPVQARTIIRQQEDGRYRWFSISGTAVLNRSGEIDSRELFDSFIAHAEQTGEYPIRQFYHQGEVFRTGQADYLARDGFCYITSGLYDDTPLGQAEVLARQSEPEFWGDSVGFFPTDSDYQITGVPTELTEISDGIQIPVYRFGINKEISTLPEGEAAHLFTRTEVMRMSLQGKAWEAFVKLWTDAGQTEEAARRWLEENPEARNRAIEQAGMITRDESEGLDELMALFKEDKDKALEWLEQRATDTPEADDGQPQDIVIDDSVVEVVTQSVVESETVRTLRSDLNDVATGQTERDKELEKLRTVIAQLTKRIEGLESGVAIQQQQVADDTPPKFNGSQQPRVVYRPREAHAALDENGVAYSQKANANLPKGAY